MKLRVIYITTEDGIEFAFVYLLKSDGSEARIPPAIDSPIVPANEERLSA